jgi:LPXTG-site transpeptidase (sortase) family protein
MRQKQINNKIILKIVGGILFIFCVGWTIWRTVKSIQHSASLSAYHHVVETLDIKDYGSLMQEAIKYNEVLYQTQGMYVLGITDKYLTDEIYQKMLRVKKSEVMARINIPKINIKLPIYHGTSDEVLANGIGHLSTSSLPVGGKNTRAILSGHRGMAEADMFTRLDELEVGDLIFIEVLNEKLAYAVTDTQVILPEETEMLNIVANEDILTLVTCTPIYTNTHRLIVNAKRIDYIANMENNQNKIIFPKNPFVFVTYLVPVITMGLLIYYIDDRLHKKSKERGIYNEKKAKRY